ALGPGGERAGGLLPRYPLGPALVRSGERELRWVRRAAAGGSIAIARAAGVDRARAAGGARRRRGYRRGVQGPEGPLPQGPRACGGLRPGDAAGGGGPELVVSFVLRALRGRGASAARRRQRRSGAEQFHAALVRARRRVRGISPRARPAWFLDLQQPGSGHAQGAARRVGQG